MYFLLALSFIFLWPWGWATDALTAFDQECPFTYTLTSKLFTLQGGRGRANSQQLKKDRGHCGGHGFFR